MSEIAGKIATQAGAFMLEKPLGGRGILLGGVPGVASANVMIIGGGAVGMNAAFIAIGMEADVFVYDKSIDRLRELDIAFGGRASTVFSSTLSIEERLPDVDLVIGGVLVHGARAPHVINRAQLELMKPSAVLVDVAIDQGGCFETSKPTTHSDPTYEVDGIIHYCVANMPGAVPITSTYALTNATLPYMLALADHGVVEAVQRDPGLKPGINVAGGRVTHQAVAEGVGMEYAPPEQVLGFEMPQNGASVDGAGRPRPGRCRDQTEHLTTTWDQELRRRDGHRNRQQASELHQRRVRRPPTGATEDVINPSTGEVIAQAPLSTSEDVDRAVPRRGPRSRRGRGQRRGSAPPRCSGWPTRSRSTPTSSPTSSPPTPASRARRSSRTRSR